MERRGREKAPPAAAPDVPLPFIDQLRGRVARVPATLALVAVNLAVFAAMLLAGAGLWHAPNAVQLEWGANFGPATKDGEWWRLATAMFLHFGVLHLALNMAALVECGRFVERIAGPWRFVLLYFGGGIAGNLLSLVVQGDRGISGGASGAIFGIYGALLVALWRERNALDPGEFRWLFWGGGGFAAANILLGAIIPGIDNAAHVGGLVFGTLAAISMNRARRRGDWPSGRIRVAAGAALAGGVALLLLRIPAPAYDWGEEKAARAEIRQFIGEDADISARWGAVIEQGRREGLSFDELAARIENQVSDRYEASFEQLSSLHLDPRAPSTQTLEALKRYAGLRLDASRTLAEALRSNDPSQIRQALELAKAARAAANGGTAANPAGGGKAP
jgi:rhomboid protease GluP